MNLAPSGNEGYWGAITSSLDWCEENYILTPYIAEFWNAISNLTFIILMIRGVQSVRETQGEMRFYLGYISIAVVSIGSFAFHASLKHEAQMADELPMIYSTCIIIFSSSQMFKPRYKELTAFFLSFLSVFITVYHLYARDPIFHQVSFAILNVVMVAYTLDHLVFLSKKFPSKAKELRWVFLYSLGTYVGGFAIWNLDTLACDQLRELRLSVGYPFRVLLEGHMWWHVLTAIGTYAIVTLTAFMRSLAKGRTDITLKYDLFLPILTISNHHQPQQMSSTGTVPRRRSMRLSQGSDTKRPLLV